MLASTKACALATAASGDARERRLLVRALLASADTIATSRWIETEREQVRAFAAPGQRDTQLLTL